MQLQATLPYPSDCGLPNLQSNPYYLLWRSTLCFQALNATMILKNILSQSVESMEQVFVSLGSNLGDRLANLRLAIVSMRRFAQITAVSDAYETQPVGFTAQPWFLNAVAGLRVTAAGCPEDAPERLLAHLLAIECAMGRQRASPDFIPKGPRLIDLDIVLYGSRVIHLPALTIPHPAMHLRRFVLQPLAQIAPAVLHPLLHRSALQLLQDLPEPGPLVKRLQAFASPQE